MPKTYNIIRPKSLTDPAYAEYEYLLRWQGSDGSDLQYMFYDAEIRQRVKTEVINKESEKDIQALHQETGRDITLFAADLSKNDLLVISGIFKSKKVERIKKDGTKEYYAPDGNGFTYRLMGGKYEIGFTLIMPDEKSWR